jgi:PAS domain S-box-containing protein
MAANDEDERLRSVALQNAQSILLARRRAEEELRKQSEWLRVTLASIGDAVISTDADGRVSFTNGVAELLTGWSGAEALGRPLSDVFQIVNERSRQAVENPALSALRGGTVAGLANDTILIAKDGTERPIDDSAAPIRNEQGEVVGSVLVFRDITERKREEAARAERGRLVVLRADISTALASMQSTPEALHQCCEALVRNLESAFARIWTLNEIGQVLELQASAGLYTHLNGPHSRVPVGQFKIGRIASTRQPHLTNSVPTDPNISDPEWALREGMVAFAGYPLTVEDRLVGVVAMFARHPLTEGVLKDLAPLVDGIAQYIDRRRAEEQVREQSELLRVTLASIGDAVITTDTQGRVAYLNAVAEALTGWTQDQAAGQPLDTVFQIVNENTREPVDNPVTRVLREGIVVGLANHTVLIAKDGILRPIDDSAAPIRSRNGEIVGCVLVFRDVTAKRQAENDRQNFVTLAENITDFIGMCDLEGVPFYVNQAGLKMVGLDGIEQTRLTPVREFFFPEDQPTIIDEFFPSVLEKGHGEIEVRFRHFKTGEALWMLYKVVSLIDSHGNHVGLATVSRDVTQRRRLEDNLRQMASDLSEANRRKDEFLATLAHELRNPLAPIRNGLQLIKLATGDSATIEQARAVMERQLAQMVRLVDDLLDVSRITRGKIELRLEYIDLASIIRQAVETSRPTIESAKQKLTVTLAPQPVYLNGDPVRLVQVFSNLLNNSCRYSEPGGSISVTAKRQLNDVLVSVKDTGIGIPPEMLPRIFEMFMQIDRSLERSEGGLGIGLTLVKRLVELHNGSVSASSEGIGRGSEFVVRLPIAKEDPTPSSQQALGEPQLTTGRRILIVDDNRDSALSLAILLRIAGNETQTAHDGLDAVKAAATFRPDVVLLDIGLPGLNGYEVARKIREQPWGNTLVLVALTGWGQDEDRKKSKAAGFNGHMVKPVDHAALAKLLADLLPTSV